MIYLKNENNKKIYHDIVASGKRKLVLRMAADAWRMPQFDFVRTLFGFDWFVRALNTEASITYYKLETRINILIGEEYLEVVIATEKPGAEYKYAIRAGEKISTFHTQEELFKTLETLL